ncbi:hypothetical protein ACYQR9_21670 [Methylobacterium sp. CM6241]
MLDSQTAGLIEKLGDHLGMREPTPEERETFAAAMQRALNELIPDDGYTVVNLDDDWLGGPVAKVSISGSHDVEVTTYTEEVTFHSDGSYSRRLG